MISLEDTSGHWSGYWQQKGQHGQMHMTLTLSGRSIEGKGVDDIGVFSIIGVYSTAENTVKFGKSYRTHEVLYEGVWDGHKLYGQWVLNGHSRSPWSSFLGNCGSFELIPDP